MKCTSCVKYVSRVKYAAAREGIYFISHCDVGAIFHNVHQRIISHSPQGEYFTLKNKAYDIIIARKAVIVPS